jgi:hypothetical protein
MANVSTTGMLAFGARNGLMKLNDVSKQQRSSDNDRRKDN